MLVGLEFPREKWPGEEHLEAAIRQHLGGAPGAFAPKVTSLHSTGRVATPTEAAEEPPAEELSAAAPSSEAV